MLNYNSERAVKLVTERGKLVIGGAQSVPVSAEPELVDGDAASSAADTPFPAPAPVPLSVPARPDSVQPNRGKSLRIDDRELRNNQRITQSHIDEIYDEGDFFPDHGAYFGGAARVYVISGAPVLVLPKGATTAWELPLPFRRSWGRAVGLELSIYYTSPVGSTATFTVTTGGFGGKVGSVQGAIADAYANGFTMPGPAVAGTWLLKVDRSAGRVFTPASRYIIPRIVRSGAIDANANDLHIMAVHWKVFGQ